MVLNSLSYHLTPGGILFDASARALGCAVTRVGESDAMTLRAECTAPSEPFRNEIASTLRAVAKLGGNVELVAPQSLPNDGKVMGATGCAVLDLHGLSSTC